MENLNNENEEIKVILSEEELKKEIIEALNSKKYNDLEIEYAKKRRLLHLMGLENNNISHPNMNMDEIEKIQDYEFLKETTIQFVDELLNGKRIDIKLLEDITKIQHGIQEEGIEISDNMKKILTEELEKYPELNSTYNLKKIKANTKKYEEINGSEIARIQEEQDWLNEIRNNSAYDNLEVSDKLLMKFHKQKPIEEPAEILIMEKPEITVEKTKTKAINQYSDDWQEKYEKALKEYGYWPVKYHSKMTEEFRRRSNNEYLDKALNFMNKVSKVPYDIFEMESVCKIDPETNSLSVKDNDNLLNSPKLFTDLRFGKGLKFETMPTMASNPVAFELATLKLRAEGIEFPHVFAAKPTTEKERAERSEFIEKQIENLVEIGDYSIDNISVPVYFEPVLEKMRRKYSEIQQMASVMSKEDIINFKEEIIEGRANTQKIEIFLSDYFDESILPTENSEDYNRLIELKNKIEMREQLSESEVDLLEHQIKVRESVKVAPSALETVSNDETSEIVESIENDIENNLEDAFEADEAELIENPKKIESFRDYEAERTNPETGNSKTMNAIIKLSNKIKKGKIIEQLSEQEINMIERKALIINTFKNNQELTPEEKGVIKKVFENGNVQMNYRSLHPAEQGLLSELIDKYNLEEMQNTLNQNLNIETTKPSVQNLTQDIENVSDLSKLEKEKQPDGDFEEISEEEMQQAMEDSFNYSGNEHTFTPEEVPEHLQDIPPIDNFMEENDNNNEVVIEEPNIELPKEEIVLSDKKKKRKFTT